jgi:hypothetical protein
MGRAPLIAGASPFARLRKYGSESPAKMHVGTGSTKVIQEVGVCAASLLKRIAEDGHAIERPLFMDASR